MHCAHWLTEGEGRIAPGGNQKGAAKMGVTRVKFNKLVFLKLLSHVLNYRFVDFCFQRKRSVINSLVVVKICYIERADVRVARFQA